MPKLIAHQIPDAIIAYTQSHAKTAHDFLRDCGCLAERLPNRPFLLNFCKSRYLFAVGMGAAALNRQTMLLPPTYNQGMLSQLQKTYPDFYILYDQDMLEIAEFPRFKLEYPAMPSHAGREFSADSKQEFSVPEIPADHVMAYVFTSGSTGEPVPHAKTWGSMTRNAQAQLRRIREDVSFLNRAFTVLATVPPQHMYGLESSVLIALLGGQAFSAAHPFFPQDICTELARLPHPRVLVSTPFHLRAWMESGIELPAVDLIISATAPLSMQLTENIEARFQIPVQEIYGCTETGQIATRLPTVNPVWQTYGEVEIIQVEGGNDGCGGAVAQGDYILSPTELNDVLEVIDKNHFRLLGRKVDQVNIAGKRSSLGYLNFQLNTIDGVKDGVFFIPDNADTLKDKLGETRLAAFVVASGISKADILKALRSRIDAAFMPRPLFIVDELPRNSTGKLPHHVLTELAQKLQAVQNATEPQKQ
ncbi:beta-hydroxyacyl-ACP dehydratase [Nitrosomonas sp. JL21]|uniref:AMP-binding protein n=1 Tax=Nitrosomonas sp. JL21 TaxID=153949 RepID=UPI00136D0328|nr:AMP-binding protein [Nitrosomonas sp. JL21]MBL8498124.1 acyl-CoA synthetase [Nitrosomonas sp.]MCC7090709.1 acyl-CoA synthetase [Nitrosomonas sp.]MXS76362.1 beta-hydroxyacyl-ACP dehydratase [Nitrosomonas sp. JL21]